MVVARHRRVRRGRAEVLTDGQNPATDATQVLERRDQLVALFAKADHHAALGRNVRRVPLRPLEQLQRSRIAPPRARHAIETRHGLRVVIEDVGTRIEDRAQRRLAALEVGDEHLDAAAGQTFARFADGVCEDRGAAVGQIVAINRRDHDVVEIQRRDGVGDPARFCRVDRRWPAMRHRAVRAGARADVAEDHEGRGAVVPALADVRALRFFADRVEIQLAHQALEPQVARRAGGAHLQPVRFGSSRWRRRSGRQRNDTGHLSVLYRPVALFHHVDVRVRWPDTDPAGIVWFGVFFRYFENAEEDLFLRLGRDRYEMLRTLKVFMPRTSLQSRFRSPAKLGDQLSVGVGVAEITDRRVGFTFDIHERGTDRLICEASYRVACVDAETFAPRPFPPEIAALLEPARTTHAEPRTTNGASRS